MVNTFFGTGWLTLGEPACLTAETKMDSYIHTCMIHKISHVLWSGLWKCTNAPLSNFRASVFQFDQEEEVWYFSRRLFICLLQSLIFFTGLMSEGKLQRDRVGATRPAFPRPVVLSVRALLEAAGAAHLPVRVQLRGHRVRDHASQDVVLCGHHVLNEEIGSVVDVEVVLKPRHFGYGWEGEHGEGAHLKMWFVFGYTISSRLRLCLVTFPLENVESGCNMKQRTSAPFTHGCQQRGCEHLQ